MASPFLKEKEYCSPLEGFVGICHGVMGRERGLLWEEGSIG